MRILFDQGTPVPLRQHLSLHEVSTAFELGWSELKNGDLLTSAQAAGFDLLVTTDKNLRYQQDLADRKIAVAVLSTPSWPRIRRVVPDVVGKLTMAPNVGFIEIAIP
jgi:hypothetical protein